MPLDEKEKEELKKRYREHRQSMWFGKHSRKLKKRKKNKHDVDDFVRHVKKKEVKTSISPEQPKKSVEIENATFAKESKRHDSPKKLADHEEQNQMVILRRMKGKKSVSETPTKIMPPVSERTTLYEPEPTRKTEVISLPNDKTTMLEQNEVQPQSFSSPNAAELSTKLEVAAKSPPPENMLKEKIKSQRQEIWSGTTSQKKRRPKKRNGKKDEKNLGLAQNSQKTEKGLTLGVVFIGIAAVVTAVLLGVLLGYLLA